MAPRGDLYNESGKRPEDLISKEKRCEEQVKERLRDELLGIQRGTLE